MSRTARLSRHVLIRKHFDVRCHWHLTSPFNQNRLVLSWETLHVYYIDFRLLCLFAFKLGARTVRGRQRWTYRLTGYTRNTAYGTSRMIMFAYSYWRFLMFIVFFSMCVYLPRSSWVFRFISIFLWLLLNKDYHKWSVTVYKLLALWA